MKGNQNGLPTIPQASSLVRVDAINGGEGIEYSFSDYCIASKHSFIINQNYRPE
jgi:hypothetical protein